MVSILQLPSHRYIVQANREMQDVCQQPKGADQEYRGPYAKMKTLSAHPSMAHPHAELFVGFLSLSQPPKRSHSCGAFLHEAQCLSQAPKFR